MIIDSSSDLICYIPTFLREWFTLNPAEPFKTAVKVASIAGTLVTIVTTLSTKTGPWLAAKIKTRSISRHLGPEFTVAGIHRSIRYYIRAWCQDLDPAGAEEPRLVYGVQEKLFEALDKALTHPTEHNFIFLLADSGMGKTSAPPSGKFVEFPNLSNEGGFLQTFIELNGEVVGALVCYFSTSQARKRVIKDTRWLTLETLLNPHEPC